MNSIKTNTGAAYIATALNGHYSRIATSVERLSSGLRINSAADDAAGMAIRELMRSDVAAINQGMRNANDAISMLQVADSALAIIDEKLIRMKELAEQAATGTYDSTQRLMIDSEFQLMGAEIDRIANATDFNGIKLLDGSLSGAHDGSGLNSTGKMKIHFGTANDSAEDYYYVEIGKCTVGALGLGSGLAFPDAPPGAAWINEAQIDYVGRHIILDVPDAYAGSNIAAFAPGLDFYSLPVGLENIYVTSNAVMAHPYHKPHISLFNSYGNQFVGPAIGDTWRPVTRDNQAVGGFISADPWWNGMSAADLAQKGVDAGVFRPGVTNCVPQTGLINSMLQPGQTFISGGVTYTTPTGMNEIGALWCGGKGATQDEVLEISQITDDLVFFIGGHVNPRQGCNRYRLRIEADITDEFLQKLQVWSGNAVPGRSDELMHIDTQQKAQEALPAIDAAIVSKDKIRAHLGALQHRLENTLANLSIQGENLQAAESRISDADIAQEMTTFVRNQILCQTSVAMLGQANSFPHMLMQLLQD